MCFEPSKFQTVRNNKVQDEKFKVDKTNVLRFY